MLACVQRLWFYGLVLGLAVSTGAVRLIQSMLYGTRPLDPAIFAAVAGTLLVVALACLVPAWRASRIDPMQALRTNKLMFRHLPQAGSLDDKSPMLSSNDDSC